MYFPLAARRSFLQHKPNNSSTQPLGPLKPKAQAAPNIPNVPLGPQPSPFTPPVSSVPVYTPVPTPVPTSAPAINPPSQPGAPTNRPPAPANPPPPCQKRTSGKKGVVRAPKVPPPQPPPPVPKQLPSVAQWGEDYPWKAMCLCGSHTHLALEGPQMSIL